MPRNLFFIILLALTVLTGCVSLKNGPGEVRDSGPTQVVDLSHIPDAVPRVEPRTIAGNKTPYTVLGKTYQVSMDIQQYQQQGIASWYGQKFHGRNTSNGEVYDMYGMTAAHKTLPIPSYVRVSNLENGKQVVVRVNDRGPFHGDRIIDLSYAAASRLGFAGKGTARVEVEMINPEQPQSRPLVVAQNTRPIKTREQTLGDENRATTFVQAGAFSNESSALGLRDKLVAILNYPVFVDTADKVSRLFKVRIGPVIDDLEFINIQQIMAEHNLGVPHLVRD
jgi:rare lipoprotein A